MQHSLELLALKKRIEELRIILQNLIDIKVNIIDPEIVAISEELDVLINMYNDTFDGYR